MAQSVFQSRETLHVSLSAVNTYRSCEQRYAYKYVQNVTRSGQAPQMDLGIWLHAYLQRYYEGLFEGETANAAHMAALRATYDAAEPKANEWANTLYLMRDEAGAAVYRDLPMKLHRMAVGYYRTWGRDDAARYEVLLVESPLRVDYDDGEIVHHGYIDLVARDRRTGRVLLWEHKSHKEIPSKGYRTRNLQVVLYTHDLREQYGIEVNGILWNYLRTVEPVVPGRNQSDKKGKMVSRVTADTTWPIYLKAIQDAGDDPAEYYDVEARLAGAEKGKFFPRFELPLQHDGQLMLRDYLQTSREIAYKRKQWKSGYVEPVRNWDTHCNWCDFAPLCEGRLLGNEELNPYDYGYVARGRREETKPEPEEDA